MMFFVLVVGLLAGYALGFYVKKRNTGSSYIYYISTYTKNGHRMFPIVNDYFRTLPDIVEDMEDTWQNIAETFIRNKVMAQHSYNVSISCSEVITAITSEFYVRNTYRTMPNSGGISCFDIDLANTDEELGCSELFLSNIREDILDRLDNLRADNFLGIATKSEY